MLECSEFWISICLAVIALAIVIGGIIQRIKKEQGIGWQFIRFICIGLSVPTTAILALNNALPPEVLTFFATIVGFAFGKPDESK